MKIITLFLASSSAAFVPRLQTERISTGLFETAIIVQNKGGGHGELGFHLAKLLDAHPKIENVTIVQDDDADYLKEPFKSYPKDLPNVLVNSVPMSTDWIDATFMQNMLGGERAKYDYVFDNCSKSPTGAHKALVDCAAEWGICKLYCYVSSAGIYTPSDDGPFPMPETTPIKESAPQNQFDQYVVEKGLPLVSFRPQYIYGPKSNKHDYLDYYFDYLVKGEPIPIPGDGSQLVSLTNAEDVASLLVSPLENEEAAISQRYFNCGTDSLVSYKDVAYMCAEAAGIQDVKIEQTEEKGNFPFRLSNFYVAPDMVKSQLGWAGAKNSLKDDLVWYYEDYKVRKPFLEATVE